jgi:Glycosyl transferases group 1
MLSHTEIMNVFVLSELNAGNTHIGWSVNHSLEETLATSCQATLMYPRWTSNRDVFLRHYKDAQDRLNFLQRSHHRIFKSWYELDRLPTLGEGPNVLIVVGIQVRFLLSIFAMGPLLEKFDVRIGYLLDGFDPHGINKPPMAHLDHLFVISEELAEQTRAVHAVNTSCLPLGVNTLAFGNHRPQRHIDIVGYGRTSPDIHSCLQQYYSQPTSDRLYFHSTFAQADVTSPKEHIALLNRLLERSKTSLCFEVSKLPRFRGHSPLLYRWLEGWAAGCAIVGTKPHAQGVEKLMDWQDSTLELPENPDQWIPFFEALLDDEAGLAAISLRNYQQCRLQHDWRYRLQDMFKTLNLPIPATLKADIAQIRASVAIVQDAPVGIPAIAGDRALQPNQSTVTTNNGSPMGTTSLISR